MEELLNRMRLLEVDHEPDGWPAVRMRDITALLDEVDRRFGIGGELIVARRERDAAQSENAKLRAALTVIAEMPSPEQDNMLAANMRRVAAQSLAPNTELRRVAAEEKHSN